MLRLLVSNLLSDLIPGSLPALLCFDCPDSLPLSSAGYFFALCSEVVLMVSSDPELPGLLDVFFVLVE